MKDLLEKTIKLSEEAGNLMLTEHNVTVTNKGTKENYVTSTDRKIEEFLRERLLSILPTSEFMGEEEEFTSSDSEYLWVVDPIDGTANYVRGVSASVVSVALVKNKIPIIGVVCNPFTKETFSACEGEGSFLNGKPISVSKRRKENALVSLAWSTYNKSLQKYCFEISEKLYETCEDLRRIGTAAYELCLIAKGQEEMLFEIRLQPWDYLAGSVILKEAGGICTSLDGPAEIFRQCTIIAANNPENHKFLKETVLQTLGDFRV